MKNVFAPAAAAGAVGAALEVAHVVVEVGAGLQQQRAVTARVPAVREPGAAVLSAGVLAIEVTTGTAEEARATPSFTREVCAAIAPSSGMHSKRGLLKMLSPTQIASM